MGLNHSPRIVTDGLVLCLDAANPKSYPGSGTTWTDLSGNGNNGTLTNGPTFSSSNGGSLVFDGVNDYASIASSSYFAYGTGDFTWEIFAKLSAYSGNHYIIDHAFNGGVIQYYSNLMRYYNPSTGAGSVLYTTGFGISNMELGKWYHLVATRISETTYLYKNGVLSVSASDAHSYGTQSITIANFGGNGSYYWNGNIALIKIYKNKGLTAAEIQQNFNALRGRYGI